MIVVMCNKDTIMTPNAQKQRRTNKPLMERKRRERINKCLNELKILVLKAQKKDLSRFTKLEKADILEMTLRHLRSFQEEETLPMPRSRSDASRYHLGFARCVSEVTAYLQGKGEIDQNMGQRLILHLNNILPHISPPSPRDAVSQWGRHNSGFTEGESGYGVSPQGQQTVARIENRNGYFTISKRLSGPQEVKTRVPSSYIDTGEAVPEAKSITETSPGREESPPWSPPSPPLSDSVQLRLSLHKIESPFSQQEATLPQFIMRPVSFLVNGSSGAVQHNESPCSKTPVSHSQDGCQEVPLNLATSQRGNSRMQTLHELDGVVNSPAHPLVRSQPMNFEGEIPIYQGSPQPLSPPSSVSSTPEPPFIQVTPRANSNGGVGGVPRAVEAQGLASPLEHSTNHWRPW